MCIRGGREGVSPCRRVPKKMGSARLVANIRTQLVHMGPHPTLPVRWTRSVSKSAGRVETHGSRKPSDEEFLSGKEDPNGSVRAGLLRQSLMGTGPVDESEAYRLRFLRLTDCHGWGGSSLVVGKFGIPLQSGMSTGSNSRADRKLGRSSLVRRVSQFCPLW